jgi:hypothetical protein
MSANAWAPWHAANAGAALVGFGGDGARGRPGRQRHRECLRGWREKATTPTSTPITKAKPMSAPRTSEATTASTTLRTARAGGMRAAASSLPTACLPAGPTGYIPPEGFKFSQRSTVSAAGCRERNPVRRKRTFFMTSSLARRERPAWELAGEFPQPNRRFCPGRWRGVRRAPSKSRRRRRVRAIRPVAARGAVLHGVPHVEAFQHGALEIFLRHVLARTNHVVDGVGFGGVAPSASPDCCGSRCV